MSIVDSRVERAAAEARVAAMSEDQVRADVAWWAMTAHDHRDELKRLHDRLQDERKAMAEAVEWVELLTEEARRRRGRREAP